MKDNVRIKYCLSVLLLALVLVAGGCGKDAQEATPRPVGTTVTAEQAAPTPETDSASQVVVLVEGDVTTLDPYRMVSIHPEESIAAHLWDTLVWLNDDLELEPRLAESWWLLDDFLWELELRQGVTFHNGEPFNAQAVKFSLERTAQLEHSLETFAGDVALGGVEIVDDYTVRIHTSRPAVSMVYELSTVEMLPPVYYAQTDLEDLARNPVGSGPYRLAAWDPAGRVVLEANADYWQGVPTIQTLVFQTERDLDERLARLLGEDAELVTDLSPDRAEAANTAHTRLAAIESTRRLFVGLSLQEETPVVDRRVRQALNYAVDVQALVTEFHAGYGQRYGNWVCAPNAASDLVPWPYDPIKAKDLLAQAGYPEGFEISMDTPVGRYYRDLEIAEAIAAQLAEVGVSVTVQSHDWPVYLRDRLIPKETAPLFLLSLASRGDDLEDTRNLAYSFPFNPTLWHNEKFEELLAQAGEKFNQTLRLQLLHEAQVVAYEEAPWIWLWRPFLFYGVSKDLDWWRPRADGLVYLYAPTPTATTE